MANEGKILNIKKTNIKRAPFYIIGILLFFGLFFGCFYSINEGELGVETRFKKIVKIAKPGLNFKVPFISDVAVIPTRTLSYDKNKHHSHKIQAYTKDQQPTEILLSLNYHIPADQIAIFYKRYNNLEMFLDGKLAGVVYNTVENVLGKYNAIQAVQDRIELTNHIKEQLKEALTNQPVFIESVQLENIHFSDAYEQSVENRMKAEVEVATARQHLDKIKVEADIARTKAQGEADGKLIQAKAEAEAITIRAKALENQGSNVIELEKVKKWNGEMPQIINGNNGGLFIQADKLIK